MIERDYIMRLIREFMAALSVLLHKKDTEQRREGIRLLCDKYVGPYSFCITATTDELMTFFADMDSTYRLPRMEMLAELLAAEADNVSSPMRTMLLEKALALFTAVENGDNTFSITRRQRIAQIEDILEEETVN